MCGQQVNGGAPAPLLCTDETSPGVLHPDVESSVQERDGPAGAHPEESHKNDLRDGTPLLPGQAERAGAVHLGEEKALGRPESSLSVSKGGAIRKKGTDSLSGSIVTGQGEMISNYKRGEFRLDRMKNFFWQ